jgi:hypothetical protein
MPSGTPLPDAESILTACKELLAASELAYSHAAERDFVLLAAAITQRGKAIQILKDSGDLTTLPEELREPVQDTLLAVSRIDEEIGKVIRREMAADQRAIVDITAKAKAFSAYDRALPRPPNFDKQK